MALPAVVLPAVALPAVVRLGCGRRRIVCLLRRSAACGPSWSFAQFPAPLRGTPQPH
ncbi:hypothetical protein KBP30_16330 [Streptomyces sp. Go40/10]|uniref:hypothetical protein n=1 Tax=Streptomyces sp. Go40/10 TaxID=2825844 RepID=UPI001E62E6F6|nr:hypothetical protein [Streptomyces sp. Go40/10]UFR02654.1 hypothetical protein KBP30_16330 [Streptomyces sp. Go40/10]